MRISDEVNGCMVHAVFRMLGDKAARRAQRPAVFIVQLGRDLAYVCSREAGMHGIQPFIDPQDRAWPRRYARA